MDVKRKTLSNLVGHSESAMKLILQSYAVPLGVRDSLMIVKCDQHLASVTDIKQAWCELAQLEHRVFRMNYIVESAEKLDKEAALPLEQLIAKRVLHILILCSLEVTKRKDALKVSATDNAGQPEDWRRPTARAPTCCHLSL